jgi:hypothetical protein
MNVRQTWTLRSLRFGRNGGDYAPAPTEGDISLPDLTALPNLSDIGIASSANGRNPSRLVLLGIACCCLCICLAAIITPIVLATNAANDTTDEVVQLTEAIVTELGSGNSLLPKIR